MIVPFISFYLTQRSDMMKIMFGEYFSALDLNQKAGKWWEIFFWKSYGLEWNRRRLELGNWKRLSAQVLMDKD